jgi:hypothetical protein
MADVKVSALPGNPPIKVLQISNEKLYTNLIRKGYEIASQFTVFRNKYPNKIPMTLSPDKNCAWCMAGPLETTPREIQRFTEEDIKKTTSMHCAYYVEQEVLGLDIGVDSHLYGEFLEQIKEINRFVLTTESADKPADPTRQGLYIVFNCPKSLSEKICAHIKEHYSEYLYLVLDIKKQIVLDSKDSGDEDSPFIVDGQIDDMADAGTYDNFPDKWLPEFKQLFEGEDKLVEVVIEDTKKERRDLYKVLLNILEKIAKDETKDPKS